MIKGFSSQRMETVIGDSFLSLPGPRPGTGRIVPGSEAQFDDANVCCVVGGVEWVAGRWISIGSEGGDINPV